MTTSLLPSRFQLGDLVRAPGIQGNRAITGICFRAGKVSYEVGGLFIDSGFVNEPLRLAEAKR